MLRPDRLATWARLAVGLAGPIALTAVLVRLNSGQSRDYVFLYLGLVAVLGVREGLGPALLAAAASFALVDYYFVAPVHTPTISNQTDLVNLIVFFAAAGLVGGLGSRRRRSQLEAEALTAELRSANDEMARLNREQAAAAAVAARLAQAQQQVRLLEEGDRVRRDLLANVSHELRTPLGSVLTGTTALAARPELDADVRAELASVIGEARRLARLVGDMLEMTRIEGGALELRLTDVDLDDAIEAAVDRLHLTHPERQVITRVAGGGATAEADWDRIGQVLDNLLANADRFAPPNTAIEVEATPGPGATVVVRVVDRGPGVPDEIGDRIFERFVRGPAPAANGHAGTGLGLAIVRGLVEAHGGRVQLEPAGGVGTCIAVTLPRGRRAIRSGRGQ